MKIDTELEKLIPPLSEEEFAQLEENILHDGIRESLIVWDDGTDTVLIDGHNRYKIGLAKEVHEQKLKEAQEIAEAVLDAEVRIGELINELPKAKNQYDACTTDGTSKTKIQEISEVLNTDRHHLNRYTTLADHPEKVEEAKRSARVTGDIVTRQNVINRINAEKPKPKSPLQMAREEHAQFQESKKNDVVSFNDVKIDKFNTDIINHDLYSKISNISKLFDWLMEEDLGTMIENLDKYHSIDLDNKLSRCQRHITSIRRRLEERRNE